MPASNEQFIKEAFEAGLTEDQVRAAVKERNSLRGQEKQGKKNGGFLSALTEPSNIGATIGDVAGGDIGPLSFLLSGAGAAGGELYERATDEQPGIQPGQILKTAGIEAGLSAVTPAALKLGGKALGIGARETMEAGAKEGAESGLRQVLSSAREWVNRKSLAQVLNPSVGEIEKDLGEKAISETFEEAAKRRLFGTPRELFIESRESLESSGKAIGDFIEKQRGLPGIDMDNMSKSIDNDIARLERLDELGDSTAGNQVKKLKNIQESIAEKGKVSFQDAWQMARDWSQEVRNYYDSGKSAAEIKPWKASAYKKLNDTLRNKMKEIGPKGWSELADDYHFWSNFLPFAKKGAAKMQTPPTMSLRSIGQKVLIPAATRGIRGVKGLYEGAIKPTARTIGRKAPAFFTRGMSESLMNRMESIKRNVGSNQ